jgi:hypothetical protein
VAGVRGAARDDAGRPAGDGRARRRPHRRLGRGPRPADRGDRRQRRRRRPRRRARRRASIRADGGPRFLELVTYRQRGHFEPDDQAYVDPAELARWKPLDPIARAAQRLLDEKVIASGELTHLRERARATVAAALKFAENSPWPDASELANDVYA